LCANITGPSLTGEPCRSQLSVGLEIRLNVLLASVYGLLIGAITRLCGLPPMNPLPIRYSEPLCCSTLASMSQPPGVRLEPVSMARYVYGPSGSEPALSSTCVRWVSQQAAPTCPAE
jgi:hypothetical protein